jgi:RNA 2',3'-cyclic 3'-phosphodiesterase
MSLLRVFIAIELPVFIQNAIQQQTASLHHALDSSLVRWVPAHNIHLTLKFLGDVSPTNIELVTQMLQHEADQQTPFDIQISGIGSFPTPRRPRVIWIGLHAPAVLESLQRSIDSAAARLGYSPEERPFSPHLTIGRVRQNLPSTDLQKIRIALDGTQIGDLGSAKVDSVNLFKSDLQPGGSVYTRLFSAPLKK